MSRPSWARPIRTEEEKIPQFPDTIVIGGFRINTTSTGALETKPVGAPPSQDPADLVQPASLRLGDSAITLEASAEFGGSIVLRELLNKLLAIPIYSVAGVEMPLISLFGSLLGRMAATESLTADLSGVRIPAVLNEVVNNASLDAAREAAQALKDAAQDASGVLIALAAGTASADIAAVSARVGVLEAIPPADLSSVEGRLSAAESAISGKADQSAVDSALADKASNFDLSQINDRLVVVEGGSAPMAARLDAVEAALPSKVAQADYDVYVAANDAAVAAKAEASALAAKADVSAVEAKEDKGRIHKTDIVTIDVTGINTAYWAESLGNSVGLVVSAGKIAEFIIDGAGEVSHFLPIADSAVAGDTYRFKNGCASALWKIVLGSQSGELVIVSPGETATVVKVEGGWKIL